MASVAPGFVYARSHNNLLSKDQDVTLFDGSASVLVPLPSSWSIHAAAAWQFAQQKLLPADLLFQIGGPTSVRGFASGTFAGDSGFYGNAELHKAISRPNYTVDVFAAYDGGVVWSTSPAQRSLQSVALGAELDVSSLAFSFGLGFPLSHTVPDRDDTILYLQTTAHI